MTKILVNPSFYNLLCCSECHGTIITDDYRGETICVDCGLIHSERALEISTFNENMFSSEDVELRKHNGGFSSLLIPAVYFHTRVDINETTDYNFKRIARLDYSYDDRRVRNCAIATMLLKQLSSSFRLPSFIRKNTMLLYKKALKKDLIRGRTIAGMLCACLYYICRKSKFPLSFKEIVKAGSTKAHLVMRSYILLTKKFNLKVPPLDPALFVSRYISELELGYKIEQKVITVLKSLPYSYITGKEPKGIIAGIIYLICKQDNKNVSQKTLATITGASEVSIRYKWKEIEKTVSKKEDLFSD